MLGPIVPARVLRSRPANSALSIGGALDRHLPDLPVHEEG